MSAAPGVGAKLLLSAISLLLTVVLIEVVVWSVLGHRPTAYKSGRFYTLSALTGHVPTPRVDADYHRYRDGTKFRVVNNGWGFTDSDWDLEKARPRVALIGDSLAASWEAGPDHRLDDTLEASLGETVEVLNMGVRGFGTDQTAVLFENLGVRFDPDVVIYVFCINDLRNNVETSGKPYFVIDEATDQLRLEGFPVHIPPAFGRSSDRLIERSFFFRRLDAFIASRWDPVPLEKHFELRAYARDYDEEDERRWRITRRLIDRLATFARDNGMEFLLVEGLYAAAFDDDEQAFAVEHYGDVFDFQRVERTLLELGRERQIPFVSLNAMARESGKSKLDLMHREDKMHLDAQGSAWAAEVIAGAMREQLPSLEP